MVKAFATCTLVGSGQGTADAHGEMLLRNGAATVELTACFWALGL